MNRFLLIGLLLLGSLCPALAQRLVTQTARLAAGQGVFLDLKFARSIRVRPGADFSVQAQVSINGNQNNDLYSLALEDASAEVRVVEKLDETQLRQTTYAGDCDGGSFNSGSDGVNVSRSRSGQASGRRGHYTYNYCARIDYDVTLPAGTALRLTTISGNLDVSGLRGAITANTISGNMVLQALAGAVAVRSVSGNVKLSDVGRATVEAKSVSGNVDLSWPAAQAATLALHTVSGEVYADPAVTFSNLKPHSNVGYQLHGSYGTGAGPAVTLESVSGDVFFRKQP